MKKLGERILFSDVETINYIKKNDYGSAAKYLFKKQKETWKLLENGYDSLNSVKVKPFKFNGYIIKVQFNPGRIISSSAKVDVKSIEARKCFLCTENLPVDQKGILYHNEYLILCNPFPIFPEHYTLANINHVPQQITWSFEKFLSLSKDLSKYYEVFYNGPKCGASAPDHLHFQAGTKYFLPIDDDFLQIKKIYGELIFESENISITAIDDGLRRFIALESTSMFHIKNNFEHLLRFYKTISNKGEEPMMNILGFYDDENGWRVLVFLRQKHRPSHYFAEGEKNILISPAAVDLGGVCIMPLEKDFNKITKDILVEIFKEVSIGKEYFNYLTLSFKKKLGLQ